MALSTHEARLFGLDLSAVWEELRRPWRDMARWPLMHWLTPELPVRLQHADASTSLWRGDRRLGQSPSARETQTRFTAVELPEDLVLRRSLTLPALPQADVAAAVALDLHSVSPFPPHDMAWGFRALKTAAQRLDVEAVLASRKQIDAHLATTAATPGTSPPEVWALASSGSPILLSGFGESRRQGVAQRWRRMGLALLLLALVLACAIAATPTLQLRIRAIEAVESFDAVHTRTVKLTREREALVKAADRLKVLATVVDGQTLPLPVLDQLTRMLPDNTFLQSLKVEGRKIAITGQTVDAATLMQQLGTVPGVQDVRAPAAAVRQPGATHETFQIEFTLNADRAAAGAPEAAASAASAPAASASSPVSAASAAAASAPASAARPASTPISPSSKPAA